MSDQIIARVSQSLAKEQSLESLVRQLLEMLEMVTDMESTYLTKVDVELNAQSQIVSLSTCTNVRDDERFLVQGVLTATD